MIRRAVLILLAACTIHCGQEHPIPEGVYKLYHEVTDSTRDGDVIGSKGGPSYWSVAKIKSTTFGNKRWIRTAGVFQGMEEMGTKLAEKLKHEELNEVEFDGKYNYVSGWDEDGWGINFSVTPTRRKKDGIGRKLPGNTQRGFTGDLFIWTEDVGTTTYKVDAYWICYNYIGVGCGDGIW